MSTPHVSALQLLPNLMTLAAICAGLTAIRYGIRGQFTVSVALIVIAAALDGVDGRLARLLKSESKIGAELDSLADFLNFGVAPGLVIWLWGMEETRSIGWIAVLVFSGACVLRLARFNVTAKDPEMSVDKAYFTGVPAPAGGLLAMLPIYISHLTPGWPHLPEPVIAAWLVIVGLLMVSRIPTFAFKSVKIAPDKVKFVSLAFVALIAALLTYPWAVLALAAVLYLSTLILSWRAWRRDQARSEADDAD